MPLPMFSLARAARTIKPPRHLPGCCWPRASRREIPAVFDRGCACAGRRLFTLQSSPILPVLEHCTAAARDPTNPMVTSCPNGAWSSRTETRATGTHGDATWFSPDMGWSACAFTSSRGGLAAAPALPVRGFGDRVAWWRRRLCPGSVAAQICASSRSAKHGGPATACRTRLYIGICAGKQKSQV